MKREQEWGRQTRAIHGGDAYNPTPAVSSPIYQSATYAFDNPEAIAEAMIAEAHPQFYGRYASPNTKQVEATIAGLEGAETAIVTASGMAAVSLVLLTFLQEGDHIVAQKTLYPTTTKLIQHKLPTLGIEATLVDQVDPDAFAAAIRPNTRLLYAESPANPTLLLTDLQAVATLGNEHGLVTVVDNTFATPYNQQPLSLGINLVLHSATKYLGGHSDIVAGAVAGRAEHISRLWETHVMFGAVLHPLEAWLLQRGLQTFTLRMARQRKRADRSGLSCRTSGCRGSILSGLSSHPQHDLAVGQMPEASAVCQFRSEGGRWPGYTCCSALKLTRCMSAGRHPFADHPSCQHGLGGHSPMRDCRQRVQPGLVRLSVGWKTWTTSSQTSTRRWRVSHRRYRSLIEAGGPIGMSPR